MFKGHKSHPRYKYLNGVKTSLEPVISTGSQNKAFDKLTKIKVAQNSSLTMKQQPSC